MALYDAHKRAELDRAFHGTMFIKSSKLASLLGIDVRSIQRWACEGKIPYTSTPGGHFLFSRKTVEEIIDKVLIDAYSSDGFTHGSGI